MLGSVNVGGNRLKMDELRATLSEAGFDDVETVAASGNVLFSHKRAGDAALAGEIESLLLDRFGFKSFVAVRSAAELRAGIDDNPFAGKDEDKLVHTHFLEHQPTRAQFDALVADHAGRGNEKLALGRRALFIDFVDGVASSKLTGAFMEKRLGSRGTARNMRSLARILEKTG